MPYSVTIAFAFIVSVSPLGKLCEPFRKATTNSRTSPRRLPLLYYAALPVQLIFGGKRAAEAPRGNPNGHESCSPGIDDNPP